MRGRIAHDARQVFFDVPADMVDQPLDFGGKLHIAINADGGLFALQHITRQREWRFIDHMHAQIRRCAWLCQVQQAGCRAS